ncbi:MAG TPA: hypothetical protein VGD56_13145, partial [Gemmatirosa sp.]
MSAAGSLDLRLPIGGLFVILGLLLVGYGVATASNVEQYAQAGGLNINLWWGLIMLVVGVLFLLLARRDARAELRAAAAGASAPPRRDPAAA